jgi:endonuclease IV
MSQKSEKSNSIEKSPDSSTEQKGIGPEKESPSLSKRESEHIKFIEKRKALDGAIINTEQSYIFGVDIEAKKNETEQKIQELEQKMGELSEESRLQIIENNVGRLEREQQEAREKLRALAEQKAELVRKRLLENWGISFQGQAQESIDMLRQQFELVKNLRLKEWQVDLRERSLNLIEDELLKFRQESPATNISFHGETPQINEGSLDIRNIERLRQETNLAVEVGSDIYTVHPPSISREIFYRLSSEQQGVLLQNYANFFAESIKQALDSGKQLVVAIENMPAGEDKFGQSIEEVSLLLNKIDEILNKQYNISSQDIERFVGITLDVNHALHGAVDVSAREKILRSWFDGFGKKIKAFHIYCPTNPEGFQHKFGQFLKLYKEYGIDAPIYLESKKSLKKTREIFLVGKENPEIQMIEQKAEEKAEEKIEVFLAKEQEIANLLEAVRSVYNQAKLIRESETDITVQTEQLQSFIEHNRMITKYFDADDKVLLISKALKSKEESTEAILSDLQEIVPKVKERIDREFEE